MSSKTTKTVTTRIPNDIEAAVREAASAEGITVSAWVSRRLRNNLRRTGRLSDTRPPISEAGAAAD